MVSITSCIEFQPCFCTYSPSLFLNQFQKLSFLTEHFKQNGFQRCPSLPQSYILLSQGNRGISKLQRAMKFWLQEVNLLSFTGNFELKLDKTHLRIDVKVLGLTFVKLAGFSFWIVCKLFCRLISLTSLLRGVEERIEIHPGKGYNQNEAPACKGYAILKKGYLHISLHISSQTRRCAVIIQKSPMKIRNFIFIEIASS